MPVNQSFDVSPYFDDFSQSKQYYKVLFKPSVSVQVREVNQLQSILQDQIEKFGNNIFKKGTIIDGCNFIFHPQYPYVKILDNQLDGETAIPSNYLNLYVSDSSNLVASIINSQDGLESNDPNLKTLYLRYINGGNTGLLTSFNPSEVLTVYSGDNRIFSVNVATNGSGFTNSNPVIFSPVLSITQTSGSFSVGDTILDSVTNAKSIILDSNTIAIPGQTILKVSPLNSDLTNLSSNLVNWTFSTANPIQKLGNSAVTATINQIYGSGASGEVVTDTSGRIVQIVMTNGGTNYVIPPVTNIQSSTGTVSSISLQSLNYLCQLTVANTANSTGYGYAFEVSEGVIFQKGYFIYVTPQIAIIDPYSPIPDGVSVVFNSVESIITSQIDPTLNDNILGSTNSNAPGADRLKLTPTLTVMPSANAQTNASVYPLVQWTNGNPYQQNQITEYNVILDEIAQRTMDSEGNYVVDTFNVTSLYSSNSSLDSTQYNVVVDPGTAYVSGYRVQSLENFYQTNQKAINVNNVSNISISLNYDNYIRVDNFGGLFNFSIGDIVYFYDQPYNFISNSSNLRQSTITPVGNQIGSARIRSLIHESGTTADPYDIYDLYLYDININTGNSFSNIRSVAYSVSGTVRGIADLVLELDPTTSLNLPKLYSTNNKLLFDSGVGSPLQFTAIDYQYRTTDTSQTVSNLGIITIQSPAGLNFPYSGVLSDFQKHDIYIAPTNGTLVFYNNLTGTLSVSNTTTSVTGIATTFSSSITPGDFLYLYSNTGSVDIKRVVSVSNDRNLILDSNPAFTNTTLTAYKCYPNNVPIKLSYNPSANVYVNGANNNILNINLGTTFQTTSSSPIVAAYNIENPSASPITKVVNRNVAVKIQLSTNAGGLSGPWCLGIPDIFRLKNVYIANSSAVSTLSSDVTSDFYIDHNQNANEYDLGYLYINTYSSLNITKDYWLLVIFDCFTSSPGLYNINSYVSGNSAVRFSNDSLPLSSLTSSINTFEIPEFYDSTIGYYDLISCFDFRPYVSNTAVITSNVVSATINPIYTKNFSNSNKYFPVPNQTLKVSANYFFPRIDSVSINKNGNISVSNGPSNNLVPPNISNDDMLINQIYNPAYPSIPVNYSSNIGEILNTSVFNEVKLRKRVYNSYITTTFTSTDYTTNQPFRYTQADIGTLDRRISALEYYVSLNQIQTSITSQNIPSSIDATVNRFIYGFIADNFSSSAYTNINSPEYSASFEGNSIVPYKETLKLSFGNPNIVMPYTEVPLISQLIVTGTSNSNVVNPGATFSGSMIPTPSHYSTYYQDPSTKVYYGGVFQIAAQGLRPNSKHIFYVKNINMSANVTTGNTSPLAGVLGGDILTNANGVAYFNYYLDPASASALSQNVSNNVSNPSIINVYNDSGQGTIPISMTSLDGLSYANSILNETLALYVAPKLVQVTPVTNTAPPATIDVIVAPTITPTVNTPTPSPAPVTPSSSPSPSSPVPSYSSPYGAGNSSGNQGDSNQGQGSGGGGAGGGDGGGGGGRVICTHFFGKKEISKELYRADINYTRSRISEQTVRGYHYWAIPYVKLMRKNKLAESIMRPIAIERAKEIGFIMGVEPKGSLVGKLIRVIGEPICYILGAFVKQKSYSSLYTKTDKNNCQT